MELILASSSRYRRELLERLGMSFIQQAPDVDETPRAGEPAPELVERLAIAKATAVAEAHPEALIIGSDQVCVLGDSILGKPGTRTNAIRQLESASGHEVLFFTGLCVLNGRTGVPQCVVEPFRVHFRTLTRAQIEGYVDKERPYASAGSFHSEGLGIALVERLEGDDPSALVGLPLIQLVGLLAAEGLDVLLP
ncbi:MAG: Maf family protein [Pseudomonadales bacterium]